MQGSGARELLELADGSLDPVGMLTSSVLSVTIACVRAPMHQLGAHINVSGDVDGGVKGAPGASLAL